MIFNTEQFAKQYQDLGIPFWLVMVTSSPAEEKKPHNKKPILNSVISVFSISSHKGEIT